MESSISIHYQVTTEVLPQRLILNLFSSGDNLPVVTPLTLLILLLIVLQ
jgi:hypothetical protein